jgi:hypothetical protein
MSIKWMSLKTMYFRTKKQKEKCIHVDGRSSYIFNNGQHFWYIAYALDDETRDDEMVKFIKDGPWLLVICFEIYLRYDYRNWVYDDWVSVGAKFVNTIVETAIIAPQV